MGSHAVAEQDELADGDHLVAQIEGREVGVYYIDGEYYAYTNWCAHQSGPICEGELTGTTTATFDRDALETRLEYVNEGTVAVCPWHGWEFDVVTGECLSKAGVSLPEHDVDVVEGQIVVTL